MAVAVGHNLSALAGLNWAAIATVFAVRKPPLSKSAGSQGQRFSDRGLFP
jgi:hypothetical protein